ncbi:hypothetical protein BG003_000621, partial [Podila horticola]
HPGISDERTHRRDISTDGLRVPPPQYEVHHAGHQDRLYEEREREKALQVEQQQLQQQQLQQQQLQQQQQQQQHLARGVHASPPHPESFDIYRHPPHLRISGQGPVPTETADRAM